MKKRILALALCLVMVVSLLPITAAADDMLPITSVALSATAVDLNNMRVEGLSAVVKAEDTIIYPEDSNDGYDLEYEFYYEESELYLSCLIYPNDPNNQWSYERFNQLLTACTFSVPGYTAELSAVDIIEVSFNKGLAITFVLRKGHEHDWQFTQTESTLTATCRNPGCPIGTVSVTLTAHSVTLPESPFNAQLEGLKKFQETFPNAVIGEFVYKYKGADDSEYRVVAPTAANAKAGEYQVGVRISGLPAGKEDVPKEDVPVEFSLYDRANPDGANQDGAEYADLFVKYTAVDPAVTAQTGDSRPIELMMAGVVVFSALAAAAFILDSKRKYSR